MIACRVPIAPLCLALLIASLPALAHGADPEAYVESDAVAPAPPPVRRDPADGSWSVLPLPGAGISTLRGAYGSLGLGVGRVHGDSWYGAAATVEAGPGGAAYLLGGGWIGAEGLASLFGRFAWLRTGERTRGVASGQDYLGVEAKGMFLLANLSVGVYRHLGGSSDAPGWLGSVGAGFWF